MIRNKDIHLNVLNLPWLKSAFSIERFLKIKLLNVVKCVYVPLTPIGTEGFALLCKNCPQLKELAAWYCNIQTLEGSGL